MILQKPSNGASRFYCYKGFHSIVLFAVVDRKYRFIYVNIGTQGRLSDGAVFNQTEFKKTLMDCKMNLQQPAPLPGRTVSVPSVFLSDAAFPIHPNLIKPYPGTHSKGTAERIFNYRLSRARNTVENSFGQICSTFRVLRKPLLVKVSTARLIGLACVYLHNYLKDSVESADLYEPPGTYDTVKASGIQEDGRWRRDLEDDTEPQQSFFSLQAEESDDLEILTNGQAVRDEYRDYFMTPQGRIAMQESRM